MDTKKHIEALIQKHGYSDFRWIDPQEIVVSQWVRMKCLYGCNEYGQTATCPPHVPTLQECERFFQEYKQAVILHFEKNVAKPEDRFAWTRKINLGLLDLERDVFLSGYQKVFLLFMDSCNICRSCPGEKRECKTPQRSRPSPEALGVDVYCTVRKIGYSIRVLSDYSQMMNRYAFLMIE